MSVAGRRMPGVGVAAAGLLVLGQLQDLINTVRGETGTYAGLWIDRTAGTVYVSTTSAALTPATVARLERPTVAGAPTMKVQVVHSKYNFAQLSVR